MPIAKQMNPKGKKRKHTEAEIVFDSVNHSSLPQIIQRKQSNRNRVSNVVVDIEVEENIEEEMDNDLECDIVWMYEYAQYLFIKYIDVDSEFSINVSYGSRQNLLLFFSKNMEQGFEYILNKKGIISPVLLKETELNDKYVNIIKLWIYHMFDHTLSEVWNLMSSDTFIRFRHTAEYKYLLKKYQKQQLQVEK